MESEALNVDELPGPALVATPDGFILEANSHFERLLECERGGMNGSTVHSFVGEEHEEEWLQYLQSITEDGAESRVWFKEVACLTKSDHELTVDIHAGATADGRVVILLHDVTSEQRVLADKAEEERRFRLGAFHIADVVQKVDVSRDYLGWYGDLEGALGYAQGDFPHTLSGWMELIHPDDLDRIRTEYDQFMASKSPTWDFRYRLRSGDGTYRHLRDRGSFVAYVDGVGVEGVGGVIDETEQVVARQELESALAEVAALKDRLQAESHYLQSEIASNRGFDAGIVGSSEALRASLASVESVSHTDATVLLLGETGTGKELLARAIHGRSRRSERPLIKVDCGTLPAGLVESELFGHEKGSFTGALDRKIGRFELAHEGTILLDEIGELPLDLQSKLLRVIEEGEFQRVGGKSDISVDVRVIAATNRDVQAEVREGRFRADLFYRLSVFPITAPPLRERREDIPDLVSFFVSKYAPHLGKPICRVDAASLDAMVAYDWPGNVRELRNVIERAVILCTGDILFVEPSQLGASAPGVGPKSGSLKEDLHGVERARILRALEESGWRIKGECNAASRLGVAPSTLRSRMRTLGITRPG